MPKILFVDHTSEVGGAELSLLDVVSTLSKNKNMSVHVALPDKHGPLVERLKAIPGIRISFCRLDGWRWWESGWLNRLKLIISLPLQLLNVLKWMTLVRSIGPDIVHFNLTRVVEGTLAVRLLRVPALTHCREHASNNRTFWGGVKAHARLIALTRLWIANSQDTLNSLIEITPSQPKVLIYNGIDVARFESKPTLKQEVVDKGEKRIVMTMLAGLVPWKNHHDFIDIAALVCQIRNDVLFLISGKGSEAYTEVLKSRVKQMGLEKDVVFTGFVKDTAALLHQTDILVHTSFTESFGRIYVEAMAAAKPVVAFRGGAASEIVIEGETGFLFNPGQKQEFAQKLSYLADNPELRTKLGLKGKEIAAKTFSIGAHCSALEHIYSDLMNQTTVKTRKSHSDTIKT